MNRTYLSFLLIVAALVVFRGLTVFQAVKPNRSAISPDTISPDTNLPDTIFLDTVFDPDALVIIDAGPDQLPGQAGVDDGGNGVVDERSELGATGSDDRCRIVFGDEAVSVKQLGKDSSVMIVQHGAFRPMLDSESSSGREGRLVNSPSRHHFRWIDRNGRTRERMEVSDSAK